MFTFPTALFVPESVNFSLEGAATSGGRSLSGLTQYASLDGGGYWTAGFGKINLWNIPKFKVFRAVAGLADGGAQPLIVPVADRLHQAFAVGQVKKGLGVGNSDDTKFSDGALWPSEYITATLVGSHALRSTQVHFAFAGGVAGGPTGGEYFTLWGVKSGQRLHVLTGVTPQLDGSFIGTIRPPLREAFSDGVTMDFDNPRCQMAVPGAIGPTATQLRFGEAPNLKFVENFTPQGLF
jgi:hypothetical protein